MAVRSEQRKELMELVYAGKLTAAEATARYLELALSEQRSEVRPHDVAVVGMSGRFPAADDVAEYWELLRTNESAIVDVNSRWPEIDELYSADLTDSTRAHSRWGGLMKHIFDFDPLFFELSPRQAQLMEPRQRLLLMECWKALEDAGYSKGELDGRNCGVFVGCEGSSDYFDEMKRERLDGNAVLGHSNAVLSARLAYFMNLRGPSMTIDTACSSSLVAMHLACQSIRDGSVDMALAGGVTVMLSIGQQLLQSNMGMLSPEGVCKTFDASADGFVPSESAAVVVLKSLESAIRDKDHIYGIIKGSAINQDGKTNGITAPSSHSQQELIERAVEMSGVDPATVRYVEAHGTGTRLGDPIEVDAIAKTYGAAGKRGTTGIGSVKTNIGHAGAASGVASLIKLLLGMKHDLIPASINCHELNPRIQLDDTGLYLVRENERMFRGEKDEAVTAVSSFGYSGTNCHLVVSSARGFDEVPTRGRRSVTPSPLLFFASAATPDSLRTLCASYVDWLRASGDDIDPVQLSLQTLALRTPMKFRIVLPFQTISELVDRLAAVGDESIITTRKNQARDEATAVDEAIGEYLAEGRRDTAGLIDLLGRIASAYRRGADGPYQRLAPLVDRRLHLPTYRFAATHYELDPDDIGRNGWARARATVPAHSRQREGFVFRRAVAGGPDLECELAGSEAFLRDHCHVLPGVIYLELFRAAAAALAPSRRVASVRNVMWMRVMQVPEGVTATIRVAIQKHGADRVDMAIYLAGDDAAAASSAGTPFATAQVHYGEPAPKPHVVPEEEFLRGLDGGATAVEDYRRLLSDNGVGVGPTFRGVRRIHSDASRALGELGLDEPVEGLGSLKIPPSLVDGGFSGIGAWICDARPEDRGLYLPFSIGRMELYDLSEPPHTVRIVRAHDAAVGDVQTAGYELTYLSEAGDVVIHVENMFLRRLEGDADPAKDDSRVVGLTETWCETGCAPAVPFDGLLVGLARSVRELELFRSAFRGAGTPNVIAAHGVSARDLGEGEYLLGGLDERSLRELVDSRVPRGTSLRFLLMGSPPDDGSADRIESGVITVMRIVRTLMRKPVNSPTELVFFSSGDPLEQAISGFFHTMNLEKPLYHGRVVTIGEEADISSVLEREVLETADTFDVRYEKGKRYELRLARLPEEDFASATADGSYIAGRTFLVTGGAGGIGLALAEHLFARGAVRVYLCGRSALDERRRAALAPLERQGLDVRYLPCDITDAESVRSLVDSLAEAATTSGGPTVDGIYHAAGVLRDRFIIAKDEESFHQVIAPKTTGANNIVDVARKLGSAFVMFFSSTSSVLGNPGQCDYSFGNRHLDALAQRGGHGETGPRLYSLNWSVWADGGMRIPDEQLAMLEGRYGLTPLPFSTGFAAMDACIAHGHTRAVVLHGHENQILANFFPSGQEPGEVRPANASAASFESALEHDLRDVICASLRLEDEAIDFDDDLARYGFDSISFSELATRLNDKFDLNLTPAIFFGYTYLHELKQGLLDEYGDELARHYGSKGSVTAVIDSADPAARADDVKTPVSPEAPPQEPRTSLAAGVSLVRADQSQDASCGYRPIAIIGMSTRLPRSSDSDEFWEHLLAGDDLVTEVPSDRWDWRSIYGDTRVDRNKTTFHHGAFVDRIDTFDPYFFGIAGTDAEVMDPQERMMLEEAWHALEDAGYDPTSLSGSDTGVFVGVSTGDYKELLIRQSYPNMLTHTMIPNRISFALNLHGPSLVVDTACSSALVSIHEAVQEIQRGHCGMALAGGVNVICSPGLYITQGRMNMLSPGGSCKTFDASADGYVRGEGCGMVVLKPLDAAMRDGDRIMGVIRGSAVNHGGTARNLFAPNEAAQSEVVRAAYRRGGIAASNVSYIETHGTGTALGDPIEVNALKRAYRDLYREESRAFDDNGPTVYLGAVKTNTGHLEAASALPGLLKILYSFEKGIIPRNIHFAKANPYLQIEQTPFDLATEDLSWDELLREKTDGVARVAALSSFGIGGVNAHMVLESPTASMTGKPVGGHVDARPHLLPVSARNSAQLEAYVEAIRAFVAAGQGDVRADGTGSVPRSAACGTFLARCADLLGFDSVEDLDLSIPFEDYGADLEALATLLGDRDHPAGFELVNPRMSLAEIADLTCADQDVAPVRDVRRFLSALCHVFQTGRTRFRERVAFVFRDVDGLLGQMDDFLADPGAYDLAGSAAKGAAEPLGPAAYRNPSVTEAPSEFDAYRAFARRWVGGADVDFALVAEDTAEKISAPTYPFDRKRFWFTDYVLDAAGETAVCDESQKGRTADAPADADRLAEVAGTIKAVLSRLLKVPPEDIEGDRDFSSYGLDSIRLIQFNADLREAFGIENEPALILDNPTVGTLAATIGEMVGGTAKSGGALERRIDQDSMVSDVAMVSDESPIGARREQLPETGLTLNFGVRVNPAPVMMLSASTTFDRSRVIGFWCDLKKRVIPELEMRSVDSALIDSLGRDGYKYFHVVVRNSSGQYAEAYLAGEGKPLLLIMGIGMAPSFASYQIEALAGKRKIVCISMPGVGLSPVIDDLSLQSLGSFVFGALDQLGIDEFDILGVSWGSLLATTLAWMQPERVTNLVLMSPNADMGTVDDPTKYVTGIGEAMTRDFSVVERGEQADRFFQDAQCLEARAFLRWSKYFGKDTASHHETMSILSAVAQRSLVIVGACDTIIHPREAEVVALYLKNSEKYVIEDASHLPLVTHPDLVNELVDRFLDGGTVEGLVRPESDARSDDERRDVQREECRPIRVLCAVNGAFSTHVARVLALALRLRDYREFEIAFSGSGPFMEMAREQGFEVIETDHLAVGEVFASADATGIHWYDDPVRLDELFEAERRVFASWRPDVCIRDGFRDPASVVARLGKVLDVMVTQANESPPYEFDFVPINYDLQGTQAEIENLGQLVRLARHKVYQPIYNKAMELGVPASECKDFGTEADLYLVSDSYALYPIKSVPDNYRYVGPIVHLNPGEAPEWLPRFSGSDRTKILITGGTTGMVDFAGFFSTVDPDRRTYTLAFTEEVEPPDFGGGHDILTSVLPHSDLFVTHGGIGSTYMGLAAAKPMIVLYDQFERQANARQLEKLGVGLGFEAAKVTPTQIMDAAKTLLADVSVKSQLEKISSLLLAEPEGSYLAAIYLVEACKNRCSQMEERLEAVLADLRRKSDVHRLGMKDGWESWRDLHCRR